MQAAGPGAFVCWSMNQTAGQSFPEELAGVCAADVHVLGDRPATRTLITPSSISLHCSSAAEDVPSARSSAGRPCMYGATAAASAVRRCCCCCRGSSASAPVPASFLHANAAVRACRDEPRCPKKQVRPALLRCCAGDTATMAC